MLDCGHEPSAHGPHTTGTAHTPDGKEICWDCAHELDLAALKTKTRYFAYLYHDGSKKEITTWPGRKLATVTSLWTSKNNMAGTIYRFRATDLHGQKWWGTSPGPGMYCRMHKCKHQ